MRFKKLTCVLLLAVFAPVKPVFSQNMLVSSFNVTVTVKPRCLITTPSIGDIDFQAQETGAANIPANTTFSVLCTKNTRYSIAVIPGNEDVDGNGLLTHEAEPSNGRIGYALFKDAALTEPWGNKSGAFGNQMDVAGDSDGTTPRPHSVYASIGNIGNAVPGVYKDRVRVSIAY